MRWVCVCVMMVASLAAAEVYVPPLEFDASDSFFLPGESHSVTEVKEAARKGWQEHVDSVRFGAYGMAVTQRINPDTDMPERDKRRWGDSFVGIRGKKPRVYMAANWSPWYFVNAEITLDGGEPVPSPTMIGRLVYAGLREVTSDRISADVIWRDVAGGYLRARCSGWRGSDTFGLALRYWPPEGRTVGELTWVLTCQPYDYSDRGHWERRRWIWTPVRDEPLPENSPVVLDVASEWQAVLHNRFAQNDAGVMLAADRESIAGMSALADGSYVRIRVRPVSAEAGATLVLGDWISEPYSRVRARWFGEDAQAVSARLDEVRALRPRAPETIGEGDLDAADLRAVEAELAEARAALQAAEPDTRQAVTAFVRVTRLSDKQEVIVRQIRSAWATEMLWVE